MKSVKIWIAVSVVLLAGGGTAWWYFRTENRPEKKTVYVRCAAVASNIWITVTTTGSVEPQNRLELKPSIAGRVEQVLVREGDSVKVGQVLAWLSSSERASLLDAARTQGKKELEYWSNVYKPSPLVAPIDGQVIVRSVEPGQTVAIGSPVVVLSDRLIVKARVDETDIGNVRTGCAARVALDAYPDSVFSGRVDHVSYESKMVNNVTMYEVEVVPDEVPEVMRSGMSALITVMCREKEDAVVVPLEALGMDADGAYVQIADDSKPEGVRRAVKTGAGDGVNSEVRKGLKAGDTIVIARKPYSVVSGRAEEKNPFIAMPGGKRKSGDRSKGRN